MAVGAVAGPAVHRCPLAGPLGGPTVGRAAVVAPGRSGAVPVAGAPVVTRGRPLRRAAPARRLVRLGHPAGVTARCGGVGPGGDGWRRRVRPVPVDRLGSGRTAVVPLGSGLLAVPGGLPGRPPVVAGTPVGPGGPPVRLGGAALLASGRLGERPTVRLMVVVRCLGSAVVRRVGGALVTARPAVGRSLTRLVVRPPPAVGGRLARRLVGPGAAEVGAVRSGGRERRHLGTTDHCRPSARRCGLVGDADVAGVALAGELGVPLGGRLDHPGRLVRVPPPVGVAAVHPSSPSPHPAAWPLPVDGEVAEVGPR
ncbi:hypothetical protein B0E54_04009 [Micromonospora sp. MH99]|nr:hypothetical protein [Micromonospora sp. MH99]